MLFRSNDIYKTYKIEMQNRNDIKYGQRIVSPLVIGYGLAVVASSSLSSARYGSRDWGYGICTKDGWQGISIDDL